MLRSIFLWFYCLPLSNAIVVVGLASVTFLLVRSWLVRQPIWKLFVSVAFFACLVVIFFGTIGDRVPSQQVIEPQWIPFHSYRAVLAGANREILRSNFMNVMLFYPAGIFFCELLPKRWNRIRRVVLTGLLFLCLSVGVEWWQYCFSIGQTEMDDVIHNCLGALLGALVGTVSLSLPAAMHRRKDRRGK